MGSQDSLLSYFPIHKMHTCKQVRKCKHEKQSRKRQGVRNSCVCGWCHVVNIIQRNSPDQHISFPSCGLQQPTQQPCFPSKGSQMDSWLHFDVGCLRLLVFMVPSPSKDRGVIPSTLFYHHSHILHELPSISRSQPGHKKRYFLVGFEGGIPYCYGHLCCKYCLEVSA